MFRAVTVVDSLREMNRGRLAVGSNSASMWWCNGVEAVHLACSFADYAAIKAG